MTGAEQLFRDAHTTVRGRFGAAPDAWAGSEYQWLRQLQSSSRGSAGEQLVEALLSGMGYDVRGRSGRGSDRAIAGLHVEVKTSTLWSSGSYRFQQLRDQDYDVVVLLGVSPQAVHLWCAPKDVVWQLGTGQHTGRDGTDTRWLEVDPATPPAALRRFGGSLGQAVPVLHRTFGPDRPADGAVQPAAGPGGPVENARMGAGEGTLTLF